MPQKAKFDKYQHSHLFNEERNNKTPSMLDENGEEKQADL